MNTSGYVDGGRLNSYSFIPISRNINPFDILTKWTVGTSRCLLTSVSQCASAWKLRTAGIVHEVLLVKENTDKQPTVHPDWIIWWHVLIYSTILHRNKSHNINDQNRNKLHTQQQGKYVALYISVEPLNIWRSVIFIHIKWEYIILWKLEIEGAMGSASPSGQWL